MFPWSPDFTFDAGHVVFLGAFYLVVLVIAGSVATAAFRAGRDFRQHRQEAIRWHADFEDLPVSARRCRHDLTGEVRSRTCPNAFDCRECATHPAFVALRAPDFDSVAGTGSDYGLSMPPDRMYHRGHTWAKKEEDGTVTVGLDDLGRRLLGRPDHLELPSCGTRVEANGVAIRAKKGNADVRLLSPVDGTVVEVGSLEDGWLYRVAPPEGDLDTRHLLSGAEVRPWILREVERLQNVLAGEKSGVGLALADGGTPLEDLSVAIPRDDWDRALGEMFLEP
jgi:glycine cleavage system H protein